MEHFQLDENSDIPVWIQLKRRLQFLILTRYFPRGAQLPTVRELSSQLSVAYNTVGKVYRDLERDGYIKLSQGTGTFVTYDNGTADDSPDVEIEALVVKLVDKVRECGMTDDEVVALLKKNLARG